MKADTGEWVRCAEEDYAAACSLMRWRAKPLTNTVCFHCQQCVEKYLKALMVEANLAFPK